MHGFSVCDKTVMGSARGHLSPLRDVLQGKAELVTQTLAEQHRDIDQTLCSCRILPEVAEVSFMKCNHKAQANIQSFSCWGALVPH